MSFVRILTVSVFAWGLLLSRTPAAGQIVRPWRATTAIVQAGEDFEVWFQADEGQTIHSASLRGPYNSVAASLEVTKGNWTYDQFSGNKYNSLITVTVPNNTPADRYDLVLITSNGEEVSEKGVKVIKSLKQTYFILHISDHHLFQGAYNNESLERNSLIVDMANIIDAEMVFITGDNVYGCSADQYQQRTNVFYQGEGSPNKKGMNAFSGAVFVTPGNHDLIGCDGFDLAKASDWWNRNHGLQMHSFTYGPGRFMLINDTWGGHYRQQIDELSDWISKVGQGNLAIAAGHGRGQMADLDDKVPLAAAFAGHNHGDCQINPNWVGDRNFVYVACALREDSPFRFNLFKVDRGSGSFTALGVPNSREGTDAYGLPTGFYEALENPADRENPSAWKPNLTLTYAEDNNGTVTENTASLENKFDTDFPDARIRFVMAKGFSYDVSPGTVEQQFDGDSVRVVDARVTLNKNSAVSVRIEPSDEVEIHSDTDIAGDTETGSNLDPDTESQLAPDSGVSNSKSNNSGSCSYIHTKPNSSQGLVFLIVLGLFALGRRCYGRGR